MSASPTRPRRRFAGSFEAILHALLILLALVVLGLLGRFASDLLAITRDALGSLPLSRP